MTVFHTIIQGMSLKGGSLVLWSFMTAIFSTTVVDELTAGIPKRELYAPILVAIVGISLFFLFFFIDLITGLQAAQHVCQGKKGYIKSHKLYRSLWKLLGVVLLFTLLSFFSLLTKMANLMTFSSFLMYIDVGVILLACGYEFHSIGENIEKRSGKKPQIFNFFESFLDALQTHIINKVKK